MQKNKVIQLKRRKAANIWIWEAIDAFVTFCLKDMFVIMRQKDCCRFVFCLSTHWFNVRQRARMMHVVTFIHSPNVSRISFLSNSASHCVKRTKKKHKDKYPLIKKSKKWVCSLRCENLKNTFTQWEPESFFFFLLIFGIEKTWMPEAKGKVRQFFYWNIKPDMQFKITFSGTVWACSALIVFLCG